MSAQVYADKWEWLSQQSNWRKILNISGVLKIKKHWTVEQCLEVVKDRFPDTVLPWNKEDAYAYIINQVKIQADKYYKNYKKESYKHRRNLHESFHELFNREEYKYLSLKKKIPNLNCLLWVQVSLHPSAPDEIKKAKMDFEMFLTLENFLEHQHNQGINLNPNTEYKVFGENPDENVPFSGLSMKLGLWMDLIINTCLESREKLKCYLDNALLQEPVKLPTLPKHVCQEFFDLAKMAEIEKKCIVCLDSDNMLLSTCGHVICQDCFVKLAGQPGFKCPECRTIFTKD